MAEMSTPKAAAEKRAAPAGGSGGPRTAPAQAAGTGAGTGAAPARKASTTTKRTPSSTAQGPARASEPGAPRATTAPARRSRPAPQAAAGSGLDRSGASQGHSAVEALLAEHIEQAQEQIAALHPPLTVAPAGPTATGPTVPPETDTARTRTDTAGPTRGRSRGSAAPTPREQAVALPAAPLPPAEDVLLGLASLLAENAWRIGSAAVAAVSGAANHAVAFVRGVAPGYASAQADARLNALAQRGRRVREERTEALTSAMTSAITSAATSDAVREMTVAAIEEATDDVLAVMLPAVLEAVTELETQERLDELMAGLLLRQLPSALEKTLPGVMIRTATRPALGLMPFLGGALPRGQ